MEDFRNIYKLSFVKYSFEKEKKVILNCDIKTNLPNN